jgi:hypothetical protein
MSGACLKESVDDRENHNVPIIDFVDTGHLALQTAK